ncbi:hypothetical protein Csp1_15630 [Corynebacterium provencense]|uniref:Uncharacterized protein n=1 Tax=Corynebacterium provencense TaxID=1737425 RepID=A0A2Z3YP77_9CORY|nr:hypothetical protein Csp1_15630 [Corynebacterium provencense]
MDQVIEVVAVSEQCADLGVLPVASRVDDHVAGNGGRGRRTEPFGDEVQCQVDAAGDAGRGVDAAVTDVEYVPDDRDCGKLRGEPVLQMVVRGRATPVEQAGLGEREGSRTDADDRPAAVVVLHDAGQCRRVEPAGGVGVPDLGARDDEEIVPGQLRPVGLRLERQALGGVDGRGLGEVGQRPGVRRMVADGAEDLRRPGDIQQVDARGEEEHHPGSGAGRCGHRSTGAGKAVKAVSTVAMSAKRPARANSVRSMMPAAGSISPVSGRVTGKVAVASVTKVTR